MTRVVRGRARLRCACEQAQVRRSGGSMLRGGSRILVLFLLGLLAAPAAFAGVPHSPRKAREKEKKAASVKDAQGGGAQAEQKRISPEAQRVMREGVGEGVGEWVPMPSTNGTPGLFTLETG